MGTVTGMLRVSRIACEINEYDNPDARPLVIQTKDGIFLTGRDCLIVGELWGNMPQSVWSFTDGSQSTVFTDPGELTVHLDDGAFRDYAAKMERIRQGKGDDEAMYVESGSNSENTMIEIGAGNTTQAGQSAESAFMATDLLAVDDLSCKLGMTKSALFRVMLFSFASLPLSEQYNQIARFHHAEAERLRSESGRNEADSSHQPG